MRFFRPAPVRVALAQPPEASDLAALYARAWDACGPAVDPRLVEAERATVDEVTAWLSGGFEVYRISVEGRVAAAARCSFPTSTCHFDRLAVLPDLRRRGYGQALLDHVTGRARRAGVNRMWTETSPGIEALVGLYRRSGFREVGRCRTGHAGDLVLLELRL